MAVLNSKKMWVGIGLVFVLGLVGLKISAAGKPQESPSVGKPALTVLTTTLQSAQWGQELVANGSVVAWQEAVIGAEVSGVRINDVRVSVGDRVVKGQVLATLAVDTMQASEAESQAQVRENAALLKEASANVARNRKLAAVGFVSAQQLEQALTNEQTAKARLDVQRARLQTSALRLAQQRITAPDSGVISARSATVGTLTQPGAELFRLIRQGRLEWHADLTAEELGQIRRGMKVELKTAVPVQGVVRAIAPAINPKTRYGQVLVDLPKDSGLIAGMFARGNFRLGQQSVSALPQSAVTLRDGGAYVFVVKPDNHVQEQKVVTGRRHGEQVEIVSGIASGDAVVASGGAFLVEGDVVRVTTTAPLPNPLPHAGEGANAGTR